MTGPAALLLVMLGGCASTPEIEPVLYPNPHLQQVGRVTADQDIRECTQLARTHGIRETRDSQVASKTAGGAVVGGASGGAWGLVRGNDAGERALAGAAAGAAAGAVRGSMQSAEASPVFRNFVQKCLRDRGYEVIGWQ